MFTRAIAAIVVAVSLTFIVFPAGADRLHVFLFGGAGDAIGVSVWPLAERVAACGAKVTVNGGDVAEIRAAAKLGRVALGGMSAGGSHAREIAAAAAPTPVDLLVTLDPPGGAFMPAIGPKPSNVRRCLNLVQRDPVLGGGRPRGCEHRVFAIDHLDFIANPRALAQAAGAICGLR